MREPLKELSRVIELVPGDYKDLELCMVNLDDENYLTNMKYVVNVLLTIKAVNNTIKEFNDKLKKVKLEAYLGRNAYNKDIYFVIKIRARDILTMSKDHKTINPIKFNNIKNIDFIITKTKDEYGDFWDKQLEHKFENALDSNFIHLENEFDYIY